MPTTSRRPSGMPASAPVVGELVAAAFAHDEALFDEVAQHLLDEERVAFGLAVDLPRRAPRRPPGRGWRHHALHLVHGEAAQGDAAEVADAPQLGERRRQRVGAVDLDVAVGADDQQPRALEVAGDVQQQVERAAVGPVQVFEDEEQRLDASRRCAGSWLLPAAGASGRPPGRRPARSSTSSAVAHLRDDAGHFGGAGAEVAPEAVRLAGEDVGAHRFDEGEVGQRERALLVAVADQGLAAAQGDVGASCSQSAVLPMPGSPDDHDEAALPGERGVEGLLQLLALRPRGRRRCGGRGGCRSVRLTLDAAASIQLLRWPAAGRPTLKRLAAPLVPTPGASPGPSPAGAGSASPAQAGSPGGASAARRAACSGAGR